MNSLVSFSICLILPTYPTSEKKKKDLQFFFLASLGVLHQNDKTHNIYKNYKITQHRQKQNRISFLAQAGIKIRFCDEKTATNQTRTRGWHLIAEIKLIP